MTSTKPALPARRDWLTDVGLLIAALAAITSSGAALAGLAQLAGWPSWLALMLPATIDLYAITATRIWLSRRAMSDRARRYARANALIGIAASVVGNAVFHAIEARAVQVPQWVLVVAVSMVPPTVIGALAHLIALRSGGDGSADAEVVERVPGHHTTERRTGEPATTEADRLGTGVTDQFGADRTTNGPVDADQRGTEDRSTRTAPRNRSGSVRTTSERAARTGSVADTGQLEQAVQEYRASVHAGEPLSERKLAERWDQSRRWARKVIETTRDDAEPAGEPADQERPHLRLAADATTGGTK